MIFDQGNSIKIARNRCLNQWHQGVECNHCIDHCPADAIIKHQNQIFLNKEKCNGCGLCLSECPTEVFHSDQWDETTIIDDIEEERFKITEFFCEYHSAPYKQDKSRNRGAVQVPACLSIISRGAWFEIGLKTDIELRLDECDDCPMSKTLEQLENNITIAAEWLESCGHQPKISWINQPVRGTTQKSLRAIETGLKITSRRDLFLTLFAKGRQIMDRVNDNDITSAPFQRNDDPPERCLPEWRKRLATIYQENSNNSKRLAYWPLIEINNDCISCEMCSKFCPSGALQTVVQKKLSNHYFTSGFCLDCRICELFCPCKAKIGRAHV